MTEPFLERFEINAIEGSLPAIGRAMVSRGLVDKPFDQLSKEEICCIIADIIRCFRESVDKEAEIAREIPF